MNQEVLMESQKFMGAERVRCICCDASSFSGTQFCCQCKMPMSLSESVGAREVAPMFLPIIGGRGVGKTVYLGMLLDLLLKGKQGVIGQPGSPGTIEAHKRAIASLKRRRFPPKTGTESEYWDWIQADLRFGEGKSEQAISWISPDPAGESVLMEIEHPGCFPALQASVAKSSGIVWLIDATSVQENSPAEELLAAKLAVYVHKNVRRSGPERKIVDIPIAIAFTKTDACPEAAQNPKQFAAKSLAGFYGYLQDHVPKHRFFSSMAVGSVVQLADEFGGGFFPMHVQPKGIVEPFAWVCNSALAPPSE